MKATGIVRKVDELGRIVIPIKLRQLFNIDIKIPVEIYTDDQFIIVKKYSPICYLCGKPEQIVSFKNKNVCRSCIDML